MLKKSRLLLLTFVMMMVAVLSACGGNNANTNNAQATENNQTAETTEPANAPADSGNGSGIDTSEEVKLKMIFVGPKPADYDAVFAELNKKLKEKVNATLEGEFLDWSDWAQKYPLKLAADEDFDLIYSANWAGYNDQSLKGGFLEITEDMISTYMPQTLAAMPQVSWDQAKVNGKLYMVPQNRGESVEKLILYREDLRKKYNLPAIDSPEAYANYLKTIAANEKGVTPFTPETGDWKYHNLDRILLKQENEWNMFDLDMPFAFKLSDATGKVFNVYETEEFKNLLTYYKDLADNNAWPKNALNSKDDHQAEFKSGRTASITHNNGTLGSLITQLQQENSPYEVALADINPDKAKSIAISTQNGTSIHATSKHPERALMVLDLLQNDKELHDLIMYGIQGVHYEPVGDNLYKSTDKNSNYTGFSNWSFNSPLNRDNEAFPKEASDLVAKWEKQVYHYPLETFVFDNSKVKSEIANLGNVMVRYALPLEYGVVKDIDKGLAELNKQLKAAGLEKVQQELQAQIDAFLAKQ
ncbi:putative aldouronate transport system substrate-binding protein [Paenibacillus phyllosphaerae]|uniref:Putative aldouronate transport system substrate-binding protein n=1 Tax=Paenibacillus phyllosphaerae TaxID=274593 RepID=A0A7W5B155_9BACL|nr:ABC transporter substrate-binding protein [Paenibacillus phyllosphaerae]MBB3112520.1 putative aldouronate transport system substrate-binding protein [Paenibacillus phyllosphaerae]